MSGDRFSEGDVIEDAYGNPAVVRSLTPDGAPRTIVQLVGSDYGRITSAPGLIRRVSGVQAEWALDRYATWRAS